MIETITFHIQKLDLMKKYPNDLYYIGNTHLLQKKMVSFAGSRKPNKYAREFTHILAKKLSNLDICIVSGGAIGIDAIAHSAAGTHNTIMVAGTGLDIRYPAINKNLISSIELNGLILSQFSPNTTSRAYNFPLRNELLVALGDILIVPYADIKSGSMRSIEYALKMGKKVYVLPHRIGESDGTNMLLAQKKAEAIYDIDQFVAQFGTLKPIQKDDFLEYCSNNPTYDEAVVKFGDKVFEAELLGNIEIKNGKIYLA